MFEIKNVSKKFGSEFALKNIEINIGKGLNFIIGASGSGKTTLLKIISGMEQYFDGEVYYCGENIKTLNEQDKSCFYNNIFGFVWQDFNLLEDLTVLENVMLPLHLKEKGDKRQVLSILKELKISELANQKVGKLSGGQKQRVAIARELVKNPQVIIADEPTSALDEKLAKTCIEILRDISKKRTVIVVTHDTSLIDAKSKVYQLDKGELISTPTETITPSAKIIDEKPEKLPFSKAFNIANTNIKRKIGKFSITAVSLIVVATLLLVPLSGGISSSSQGEFDKLFDSYGNSILDISVAGSFMSAGGTGGVENGEPKTDITQDIGGLYEKYLNDERVDHMVLTQAFNYISITVDGRQHSVESSGSVPVINKLLAGNMPLGTGLEVVVPRSFAEKLGLSDDEIISKEINFNASIYNWESGEPVIMPVKISTKVVGVIDTTAKYDYEGQIMEYSADDSFFFSKSAIDDMRKQAGIEKTEVNFSIRTKTPVSLIEIKDELNAKGIVPLGRFELVEDMVRLNSQTTEQSSAAIVVIALLAIVIVVSITAITAFMRKREYAIYKISGYSKSHLINVIISETVIISGISAVVFLVVSPMINSATTALWNLNILNRELLSVGAVLVIAMGMVSCVITSGVAVGTKAMNVLKSGDK